MMKKISLLLCLCGLFTLVAQAEPAKLNDNLYWEIRNDSLLLTSPDPTAQATMYLAVENPAPWAEDSASIKAVVMPDSLTYISAYAFYYFTKLDEVTIPAGVQEIGNYAFSYCVNLKKVTCLPDSPPTFENTIFDNCHKDLEICVPKESLGLYTNEHYPWGQWYGDVSKDCSGEPTSVETVVDRERPMKQIENDRIVIIRNNEKYDLTGKRL